MFLCVRFLGAWTRPYEEGPEAVAVGRKDELVDLNLAARRLGFVPGPMPARIRLASAGVRLEPFQEDKAEPVRKALYDACLRLTPSLQCLDDGLFLLNVPQADEAVRSLAQEGDGVWVGLGKTAFAARVRLAARLGPKVRPRMVVFVGALGGAPPTVLDPFLPAPVGTRLIRGGFRTLAALQGRSPADLTPWIGRDAQGVIQLLTGRRTVFAPDSPLPDYTFHTSLGEGVMERSKLAHAVLEGARDLAVRLRMAPAAARKVELRLETEAGRVLQLEQTLLRPSARAQRLYFAWLGLIEKAKITAPVVALQLEITAWDPIQHEGGGFFGASAALKGSDLRPSYREERLAAYDPWRIPREGSAHRKVSLLP